MKNLKTSDLNLIYQNIVSLSIDLTILKSLTKFLYESFNSNTNIKNSDRENIILTIQYSIDKLIQRSENIENILEM